MSVCGNCYIRDSHNKKSNVYQQIRHQQITSYRMPLKFCLTSEAFCIFNIHKYIHPFYFQNTNTIHHLHFKENSMYFCSFIAWFELCQQINNSYIKNKSKRIILLSLISSHCIFRYH